MLYFVVVLFVVGVALLAVGYRNNRRNMLLTGAIVLFASASVEPFVEGLVRGFMQTVHGG